MKSAEMRNRMLVALQRVLRPIARLLIGAGIRFDEFAELARGVYVESAIRNSTRGRLPATRERVSMITGLTRREIDYYIDNEGALPRANPTLAALLVEVLHKWHTVPQYSGPYGIPLELEFDAPGGRCFRSLVALVDPAADPRLALQELLRTGAAAPSGEKHFRAVSRSLSMSDDPTSPRLIEHFGMTLSRLAATLEYNMHPEHPEKRLERFVMADRGLTPEIIPEFEAYVRDRAADFVSDLDNWLAPYASEEPDAAERVDTGVNVFLYAEPLPLEDEPLSSADRPESPTGRGKTF
ncbi:MAG: DUF6502 family protein [Steroidobacteraceae bacterium]